MKEIKEYQITKLNIKDIKIDGDNPNKMDDETQNRLSKSIDQFGNTQPIVIDKRTMILADGEHRLQEYISRGISEVPVFLVEFKTDAERRAYRQAANKIRGMHDPAIDAREYLKIIEGGSQDLLKMATGLSISEVQNHLRRQELLNKEEDFNEDDMKKEIEGGGIQTKIGDIYLLGDHMLMCGDSTKKEDVDKLLKENKPVLMVTDPPYGVDYDPTWRNKTNLTNGIQRPTRAEGKVQNDTVIDWSNAYSLFPGDICYIWHAGKFTSIVQESIEKCGFEIINQIIWVKPHFILSRGDYHWKHEPCLYAVRIGKNHNWQGSRNETTAWEIAGMNCFGKSQDIADETTGHGTQKPLECMAKPIINNTQEGDYVYDPFVGSGTTLIAAERLGRKALCMDIDPLYCDVTIRRWEKFSGKKAERVL